MGKGGGGARSGRGGGAPEERGWLQGAGSVSVDVRPGPGQPVAELPPLGRVDIQCSQLVRGEPADVAGLVVGRRGAADRSAEQDQLPLLADLPFAVSDDVPWVGVDAEEAGDLGKHAGPFQRLADSARA